MPANKHIEDTKTLDKEEAPALQKVLQINRIRQMRSEISIIADRSFREKLIDDEAYSGYKDLAQGREQHQMSIEMLEGTRKFADDHEKKALRIHDKIVAAKQANIASESDEEFLMQNLVIENIQFANKSDEVERLIDEKLNRMKVDKDAYSKFAQHRLIKNIGYLKVDGTTKIDFPNEEEFMKLSVPKRRELLDSFKKSIATAEAHATQSEDVESKKLTHDYSVKLNQALSKGIIGQATHSKFMDGFKNIDNEEREHWLGEFDEQMQRYEDLWSKVRSTLQGPALAKIEAQIDSKGYTELFAEFARLEGAEKIRLSLAYANELGKYREQGLIGRHTQAQFVIWMHQQGLKDQYQANDRLPEEMKRYETLQEDISGLNGKQQDHLKSKLDLWGYTELKEQYDAFKEGRGVIGEGVKKKPAEDILSQVQSAEVRDAILQTDDLLESQGATKKGTFMKVLGNMFNRASSASFDAHKFQGSVRKDDRKTEVTINNAGSMDELFAEDGKKALRSKENGGKDELSLSISGKAGNKVDMKLREIRVAQEFLSRKEDEEESLNEAA